MNSLVLFCFFLLSSFSEGTQLKTPIYPKVHVIYHDDLNDLSVYQGDWWNGINVTLYQFSKGIAFNALQSMRKARNETDPSLSLDNDDVIIVDYPLERSNIIEAFQILKLLRNDGIDNFIIFTFDQPIDEISIESILTLADRVSARGMSRLVRSYYNVWSRMLSFVPNYFEEGIIIQRGPITMNVTSKEVWMNGNSIDFSPKEFQLLHLFMDSPSKRRFNRFEILRKVWGEADAHEKSVDVHIRWIREKLEKDPSKPKYLLTQRGIGYYLNL